MLITHERVTQFQTAGFFVLESVISESTLAELRVACDDHLQAQIADMERVGTETLGLTHKEKRYSIATRHEDHPALRRFLFGDLVSEIVQAVLGDEAYLFHELFAIKWPRTGIPLGWHQDSGYLMGLPHKPYLTLWCALDDMTEANGTVAMLPLSLTGKEVAPHRKDKATNDFVGYFGGEPGLVLAIPAGSIVAMSSLTFHRSGANITPSPRRALVASYSCEPITDKQGNTWNLAAPFLKNGKRVSR